MTSIEERLATLEHEVTRLRAQQAIRELGATYQRACDGGWSGGSHRDPDFLTSLFTPDARYQLPDMPECRGHDQIHACFTRLQGVPWIVHYLANDLIDVAVDGMTAHGEIKGSAIYFSDGVRCLTYGRYVGSFAQRDGAWRFTDWEYLRARQPVPVAVPELD